MNDDPVRALTPVAAGGAVEFLDGAGEVCRGSLREYATVRFERVAAVRAFPTFRGQRNFPGSWWWATTGTHVGFESWLERDHVMLADFDPEVVGLASQPFWLTLSCGGRTRRHAPDFFARLADGTGVVVDVRAEERIKGEDAEVFAATAAACKAVGWDYRRVGTVDPVLAANVRWLAGYRHRRNFEAGHATRLIALCAEGRVLAEVAEEVGERLSVLPVLFHLLWTGVLRADLDAVPLSASCTVTTGTAPSVAAVA